ncbi:MAG TPA: right-handed parallel beta-helix repeat-containing protein [Rhodoblastus sp.]|nr:right-handed parallel beta-helix repeat-containing protein [Rhodoblastus sp.]
MRNLLLGLFTIAAAAAAPGLAQAQATRTWVSGVGDDANPCSRTAPCKTFAGAISKTASAGEINVLDPGGFGAVTITKPITIRSDHIEAGVLVSGTNGIVISNSAGGQVVLEGLDIEGLGTGLNGVTVLQGASVYIIRCTIHNFAQNGVNMASSTAAARLFIKDSIITQNGVAATANTGGVNVQGNGVSNFATILDTVIDSNANYSIQVSGAGNTVGVARSFLVNAPAALALTGGAVAASIGPSNIVFGTGSFTSTTPFK